LLNWKTEFFLVAALAGLALLLGLNFATPFFFVALLAAGYLVWQLRQLLKLYRWLETGGDNGPPQSHGLWSNVFERIYQREMRQRRKRDALQSELDHLHESFAALPDGVVMLSEGDIIAWSNDAAVRLLGLRYPQDKGLPLTNLLSSPDFLEYLAQADFSTAFDLRSPVFEVVHLQVQLTEFGEGHRILFARDVTTMRQTEKIRKDFIANVSHELRTPLTVISGYLETMEGWARDKAPEWDKAVTQMRNNASRMETLVADLILLSRLESMAEWEGQSESLVAVRPLLESICQNALEAIGPRDISIDCPELMHYQGHQIELESIFANLILNACRYTKEGGKVDVQFKVGQTETVFSVKDDGIGIDTRHIPRLTERFYRVDEGRSGETGGTGLGLAIVKHALARYGGTLEIDSQPGHGSTFTCHMVAQRHVNCR